MVATGREPTLPPDLQNDAFASPSLDDPADYVEVLRQRLSMDPPADDCHTVSSLCQPVPRGESHFCNDNYPRAHQQVNSSVERPI